MAIDPDVTRRGSPDREKPARPESAGDSAAPTPMWPDREALASHIGPYRVLETLGQGGFGTVLLAEQTEPVRRRVALKVLKLGMDTREIVARFEQERQALALMDHSNIAKVFDAGTTDTGRPFFAMEHVPGQPITTYCDEQRLAIPERLALFLQVCHAVQHAHQKGVIHRDIKPSNVLVSRRDEGPHAVVIDFGIAKALSVPLTSDAALTAHHQLIGTPEYMSPEQAEGSLDVDTRTDVYALGVLMYELLTGTTPLGARLRAASHAEMVRVIRDVEPPDPSTRVLERSDTLARTAEHRHTDPARLRTLLRGELDWIVMKAMAKDRRHRYETANGLAADVTRFLSGDPVVAAPPSTAYRARKFVARHRASVISAAVVAATLVLGLVGTGIGLVRAERARRAAVAAQENEAREHRRAEAMNAFLRSALVSGDPNQGGRQDFRVVDALSNAVRSLDDGAFAAEPDVEVSLRLTIASILSLNARPEQALAVAEQALAVSQRAHAGDHPDSAAALEQIARAQMVRGRSDAAEPFARRALEMRRRLDGADGAGPAVALKAVAGSLANQGRYAEAEPFFAEALALQRRLHPGDHRDRAQATNDYGYVLMMLGRTDAARPLFEESLAMRRRLFGGDHPDVAEGINNVAWSLERAGRLADAEGSYREALSMYRRMFTGDHPWVGRGLRNLAWNLTLQGRWAEAMDVHEETIAMARRLQPGDDVDVAHWMRLQAACLVMMDRTDEALVRFAEARRRHARAAPDAAPRDRLGVLLQRMAEVNPSDAARLRERLDRQGVSVSP